MQITTLTINPALDESCSVPLVEPDHKLRCSEPVREPGGGGINVARAIHRLGGDVLACFPAGGPVGDLLVSLLDAESVRHRVTPVRGWTRENLNILETTTGRQFRFCMPGAALGEAEWTAALDDFIQHVPAGGLAVMSGSLAPGVPADFYARAGRAIGGRGARVVLDASGEALQRGVEPGVFLLKVSQREFEQLVGATNVDEAQLTELAFSVVARGTCEVLVVSLGAGGALWVTRDQRERLTAPFVTAKSAVGAGDSMVAGIVHSLARGRPVAEAMRFGVAAGSAAVMQPGTALCRRDDVERLYALAS